MKQTIKKVITVGILLTMTLCAGCSGGQESSENSSEPSVEEMSVQSSSVEESAAAFANPLTGLEIDESLLKTKPVAIMINNIEYAQPLMGISKADIAYECLVEGGITRIAAIYKDVSSVGMIGNIRSARPPFIELARGCNVSLLQETG